MLKLQSDAESGEAFLDFGKFAIITLVITLVFAAPSCVGILSVLDAESFGSEPS